MARRAALVILAVFALLVGVTTVALIAFNASLDFSTERHHLKPIPISTDACPAVRSIHEAANRFETADPVLLYSTDDREWKRARARLAKATDELTYTIAAHRGRFPVAMRQQLDVVLVNLRAGRKELVRATDAFVLLRQVSQFESDGRTAFGYASDLVGDQCVVRLEADVERLLMPTTTTAPTRRGRRSRA